MGAPSAFSMAFAVSGRQVFRAPERRLPMVPCEQPVLTASDRTVKSLCSMYCASAAALMSFTQNFPSMTCILVPLQISTTVPCHTRQSHTLDRFVHKDLEPGRCNLSAQEEDHGCSLWTGCP